MTTKRPSRLRKNGQALVEFTFVGIPILFVLISVFEVSRGMWIYHTMAHAVRDGVRYASVHGYNCTNNGNNCAVTMGPVTNKCDGTNTSVAEVIRCSGVGLSDSTTVSFYTLASSSSTKVQTGTSCSLSTTANLCSSANTFPPPSCNAPRACRIEIDITTPFNSAIAMFWPGAVPVSFASGILGASSADVVQY